jgi:hypothetical protein
LATSTLVTLRDLLDAAPETGRELFEFVAMTPCNHATPTPRAQVALVGVE